MKKLEAEERFLKKFQLLSTRTQESHQRQIKQQKEVDKIQTQDREFFEEQEREYKRTIKNIVSQVKEEVREEMEMT